MVQFTAMGLGFDFYSVRLSSKNSGGRKIKKMRGYLIHRLQNMYFVI